jgi:V/A-type H+/Na+-transporting ATPase subunit C
MELKYKKLKLGTYPYTYVRTAVMKSLLFKKEDYQKMLKMGFNEIAKFLQDSNYKNEINELSREHSGADLLELALNKSLSVSFKKLMRISPDEVDILINQYAKRKDIDDIKTILRGKLTKTDDKLILNSLTAAGALSLDYLHSLMKMDTVEDILKNNKIVKFDLLKEGLNELNEKNTLAGIENALDRDYYQSLIQFASSLPKQGRLFKGFISKEVEILNILTLLRLKKSNFSKEDIKKFIIPSVFGNSKIMKLAEVDDLEELSRSLEQTEYRDGVQKGIQEYKENGSLITLETEMYKHLLRKTILLLHQHPLSVEVILGYMFAKEIEVRNLKIIVKGKQLGLEDDFIEGQLVW